MRPRLLHPAQIVPIAFLAAIAVGTVLLSLPAATPGPTRPPLLTAVFTAVSAVCVTGLTTVDTATYWSPFGQVVILGLIQVGGFGIMTLATL
ncbi:MAG TPA: potassium transporter TrkG, partial [Micropruina sp.]|nr:potassium transporter TrkG [Micropruina sp.]